MDSIPAYLKELNDRQYDAVIHLNSPLLILAGAGSGKTRVITSKITYMLDCENIHPSSILAVTFTNKAAREMKDRVSGLLEKHSDSVFEYPPMIRTFHSFGAWVLRRNSSYAGLDPNFSIYDDDDSLTLLHGIYPSQTKKELKPYIGMISRAKDYALLPGDDLSSISFDPDFPEIYLKYQAKLDSIGNADFGDLILKPYLLFKKHPEIRERMRQRFKYILVDEYQDSNVAQFEMLKQLSGTGENLTVVGDDDQSIYRFRGAEVKNILTFPDSFKNTKIIKLEENYRSTENILDIASAVVSNNSGRLGKTLWTRKKGGAKTVLSVFDTQNEEAVYCASLLKKENLYKTAILYRTNAQSLAFESLLTRLEIPYRIVGALKFYEREEIKDIIAWLSFLMNTKDEVSFKRIINKPAKGIGKSTLEKIMKSSLNTGGDLYEAVKAHYPSQKGKAAKGMEDFCLTVSDLREAMRFEDENSDNLSDFIKTVAVKSGFADHYREIDRASDTQRVQNIEGLVNHASVFHADAEGLTDFLENIELDRSSMTGSSGEEEKGVTLITMHNTKGLEFDRVIITGMEEGLFPGFRSMESEELIEEERRIFYVSITRARKELFITSCRSRLIWGKINFFSPSRFLSEIPEELYSLNGTDTGLSSSLGSGDRVYHDDYGSGVVIKTETKKNEQMIHVMFETGRSAVFLERYSRLEKLDNSDW